MSGEIVVLTGAAGCLGYHTLRLLIISDENVEVIRCLDLREPKELMRVNLEKELDEYKRKFGRCKKIEWIKGDIRDINVTEKVLDGADCIIHCAARLNIWTSINDKEAKELESINVGGTVNLLEAAIKLGIPRFIHVSSFEIYMTNDTIYYATETTLPERSWSIYGQSAETKKEAELKVKHYSNSKLNKVSRDGKDSLNAIIIRLPLFYGEFDNHYVPRIIEIAKFFGGKLRRFDNIWIRHQPIYVGNAAWALLRAKKKMVQDQSISGEEFHITDETAIEDPFDNVAPYLSCKGIQVTKEAYAFLPAYVMLKIFMLLKSLLSNLDFLGLFSSKRDRLQEALDKDNKQLNSSSSTRQIRKKRWYDYFTPQYLSTMCTSAFLNRTKASLRLAYEPIFSPDEARKRSIEWYKENLEGC